MSIYGCTYRDGSFLRYIQITINYHLGNTTYFSPCNSFFESMTDQTDGNSLVIEAT